MVENLTHLLRLTEVGTADAPVYSSLAAVQTKEVPDAFCNGASSVNR